MEAEVSEGFKKAIRAVNEVAELPDDQKRDYLEMLGHSAVIFMRMTFGDDYARGWLHAALADLDNPIVMVAPIKTH